MREKQDVSIPVLKFQVSIDQQTQAFRLTLCHCWALTFIFRLELIDSGPLCRSLSGTVPSRGACVGQTKALQKVEAMMRINGWKMSAAYLAGELWFVM